MIEELLERARKRAQEAEVYEATAEESPVLFEANRVKQLQTRHSRVLALRVIKDGHVGYALARGGPWRPPASAPRPASRCLRLFLQGRPRSMTPR